MAFGVLGRTTNTGIMGTRITHVKGLVIARGKEDLLRDLLRLYPTSQEDRAAAVGVGQSSIQRWEADLEELGTFSVGPSSLEKIRQAVERAELAGVGREREEKLIAARWMERMAAQLRAEAARSREGAADLEDARTSKEHADAAPPAKPQRRRRSG